MGFMDDVDQQYQALKDKESTLREGYNNEEYIARLEDALMAVEFISMHEEELDKNLNTDMERRLHNALNKIYRITHVARLPGCLDKHEGWEGEFKKLVEAISSHNET